MFFTNSVLLDWNNREIGKKRKKRQKVKAK